MTELHLKPYWSQKHFITPRKKNHKSDLNLKINRLSKSADNLKTSNWVLVAYLKENELNS